MRAVTIKTTVYLEAELRRALREKALETSSSVSDLVNDAVRSALAEDAEDLAAFEERAHEPLLSCDSLLKELKIE